LNFILLGFQLLLSNSSNRLWATCSQRNEQTQPWVTNDVTLFRITAVLPKGDPILPKVWFRIVCPKESDRTITESPIWRWDRMADCEGVGS